MKSVSQASSSMEIEGRPGFDTLELSPGSDRKFRPEGSLSNGNSGIQSLPTEIEKSLQPSDNKNESEFGQGALPMPNSTEDSISRESPSKFSSPFLGRTNLSEGQEAHKVNEPAPSLSPQEKILNPSDLKNTISVYVDDINHRFSTRKIRKMETD